jgi:HSP20 family molecular chaperone IbpA
VSATYVDGILTVTLPRRPATQPRRIQINAA